LSRSVLLDNRDMAFCPPPACPYAGQPDTRSGFPDSRQYASLASQPSNCIPARFPPVARIGHEDSGRIYLVPLASLCDTLRNDFGKVVHLSLCLLPMLSADQPIFLGYWSRISQRREWLLPAGPHTGNAKDARQPRLYRLGDVGNPTIRPCGLRWPHSVLHHRKSTVRSPVLRQAGSESKFPSMLLIFIPSGQP